MTERLPDPAETFRIPRLQPGMDVRGIEGDGLGRILRTRGDAFQVELESGDAPWILRGAVFTVDDGAVTLICRAQNWFVYRTGDSSWP